jgi:hypothetical protein
MSDSDGFLTVIALLEFDFKEDFDAATDLVRNLLCTRKQKQDAIVLLVLLLRAHMLHRFADEDDPIAACLALLDDWRQRVLSAGSLE